MNLKKILSNLFFKNSNKNLDKNSNKNLDKNSNKNQNKNSIRITNKKTGTYVTTDRRDKNLRWDIDNKPTPMRKAYIVLSEEERAKGFVRPVRQSYIHKTCNRHTSMSIEIAETYARDPNYYGATYCSTCQMHRPVSEFLWAGTNETVGS